MKLVTGRYAALIAIVATLAGSSWVAAQDAPESLLPPGFDNPPVHSAPSSRPATPPRSAPPRSPQAEPAARPAPRPAQTRPAAKASTTETTNAGRSAPAPSVASETALPAAPLLAPLSERAERSAAFTGDIPPLDVLERMPIAEVERILGFDADYDMPAAARRTPMEAGILDVAEGGVTLNSVAAQNGRLVRAMLSGNKGELVSRWGHILMRRVLASRLAPPKDMNPADFAAERAALLLRMGEAVTARALVQDVDIADYTPALIDAAFNAFVATADFAGICPVIALHGDARRDPEWNVAKAICQSFSGSSRAGLATIDRSLRAGTLPRIDMLLAQKYAGAIGKSRRAVTIEWDKVTDLTPWRYGLTLGVGLLPPERLTKNALPWYAKITATAPMAWLAARAKAADIAGASGVLSSDAMVDLYSQIAADQDPAGDWLARAKQLRTAYTAPDADGRYNAMASLWDSATDEDAKYGRKVLTAYAAARLPVREALSDRTGEILSSMLTAGLDRNAAQWAPVIETGSQGWALLTLASVRGDSVSKGNINSFLKQDRSRDKRKGAFLIAGLAGLGRLPYNDAVSLTDDLGVRLGGTTRWIRLINRAAEVDKPAMVAMLAGLGMQGEGWDKMTPRYLYHIVAALHAVGLDAEARMIAAEAVARG